MRKVIATIVCLLTSFSLVAYDRCDDLCRVLGHRQGGACVEIEGERRCICQPGDVDRSDVLENIFDILSSMNAERFLALRS